MKIVTKVRIIAQRTSETILLAGNERPEEKVGFFPLHRWKVDAIIAASKNIDTVYVASRNKAMNMYRVELASEGVAKETMRPELIAIKKNTTISPIMPKAAQRG